MFASINSCRGGNKLRRDDIESLMYFLFFLLNDFRLPWDNISEELCLGDKLIVRDQNAYIKKLLQIIPSTLLMLT